MNDDLYMNDDIYMHSYIFIWMIIFSMWDCCNSGSVVAIAWIKRRELWVHWSACSSHMPCTTLVAFIFWKWKVPKFKFAFDITGRCKNVILNCISFLLVFQKRNWYIKHLRWDIHVCGLMLSGCGSKYYHAKQMFCNAAFQVDSLVFKGKSPIVSKQNNSDFSENHYHNKKPVYQFNFWMYVQLQCQNKESHCIVLSSLIIFLLFFLLQLTMVLYSIHYSQTFIIHRLQGSTSLWLNKIYCDIFLIY